MSGSANGNGSGGGGGDDAADQIVEGDGEQRASDHAASSWDQIG